MDTNQLIIFTIVPVVLITIGVVGNVFFSISKRIVRKFNKIKDQLYKIPGFNVYKEGEVDVKKLAETEFEYDEYYERKKGRTGVISRGPVKIYLVYSYTRSGSGSDGTRSTHFVTSLYVKKTCPFNKLEVIHRPKMAKFLIPSTIPVTGNEDDALSIVYHHKTGDDMHAIKRLVEKILPVNLLHKIKLFPWSTMVFDKKRIRITISGFYKDIEGLSNMIDVLEKLAKSEF